MDIVLLLFWMVGVIVFGVVVFIVSTYFFIRIRRRKDKKNRKFRGERMRLRHGLHRLYNLKYSIGFSASCCLVPAGEVSSQA